MSSSSPCAAAALSPHVCLTASRGVLLRLLRGAATAAAVATCRYALLLAAAAVAAVVLLLPRAPSRPRTPPSEKKHLAHGEKMFNIFILIYSTFYVFNFNIFLQFLYFKS